MMCMCVCVCVVGGGGGGGNIAVYCHVPAVLQRVVGRIGDAHQQKVLGVCERQN